MVNGATGKVAYLDSLGSYQTSTPVVIDLNADGIDEAILNVNVVSYDIFDVASFHNILVVMDFKENQVVQLWSWPSISPRDQVQILQPAIVVPCYR